jgi:hypothetical protein
MLKGFFLFSERQVYVLYSIGFSSRILIPKVFGQCMMWSVKPGRMDIGQSNHTLLGHSPPRRPARRAAVLGQPSRLALGLIGFGGHGRSMDFETKHGEAEV